jgi:hypothetical protein
MKTKGGMDKIFPLDTLSKNLKVVILTSLTLYLQYLLDTTEGPPSSQYNTDEEHHL